MAGHGWLVMRAAAIALLLAGCDSFEAASSAIKHQAFITTVTVDPRLPTLGLAVMRPGICEITLRKYPICLLHEIRHCIEGNWHEGRDSDEDCY
jgi:hypothetical protein